MLSQDGGHGIILLRDRIIQGRLATISGCAPIDVSAMNDEHFGSSPVCVRVAAAARRTAHGDGVQRCRSYNGVLINVRTAVEQ